MASNNECKSRKVWRNLTLIFSDDDYELPNQPIWQKDQIVKFDDIQDGSQNNQSAEQDDEQVL